MRVTTKIDRPDPALVEQLGEHSSATIHEAQGRLGTPSSAIKPVDQDMAFCGPAFTVCCAPQDNIMLQVAIAHAQPGDVIVVSAGEYAEAGAFGDVLANACQAKGLAGVVTDTGVRDTQELRKLGFPVFSHSVSIKGTVKDHRSGERAGADRRRARSPGRCGARRRGRCRGGAPRGSRRCDWKIPGEGGRGGGLHRSVPSGQERHRGKQPGGQARRKGPHHRGLTRLREADGV